MNTITPERLAALAIAALEHAASVRADPVDPDSNRPLAEPTRSATIAFEGPVSGEVLLRVSDGFLREIASSMLGVEPGAVDLLHHGADAIKRLTHIVGGTVIHDLGGAEGAYSLGLPRLTEAPPPSTGAWCALMSGRETLRVYWAPSVGAGARAA